MAGRYNERNSIGNAIIWFLIYLWLAFMAAGCLSACLALASWIGRINQ